MACARLCGTACNDITLLGFFIKDPLNLILHDSIKPIDLVFKYLHQVTGCTLPDAMMNSEKSAPNPHFETKISGPEPMSPKVSQDHTILDSSPLLMRRQNFTNDYAGPVMGRVKKAFAYCAKHTPRLPRSKSSSGKHEDIGLNSMSSTNSTDSTNSTSSTDSTGSYHPGHRRRATMFDIGRGESSSTQGSGTDPNYCSDRDPFITSPSWFREEYLE
jgi:hypothetical protein